MYEAEFPHYELLLGMSSYRKPLMRLGNSMVRGRDLYSIRLRRREVYGIKQEHSLEYAYVSAVELGIRPLRRAREEDE